MAGQTNYNQGVTSVQPSEDTPNDYLSVRGTPASFGGELAQGGEALGQGAQKGAQFYEQAAADDASNNLQDSYSKILYGDPSKPNPDGTPDTGFLGLKGAAALNAAPNVQQTLDSKLKEIRGTLSTPEQQLQFDNFSRRYRMIVDEKIGSHTDSQTAIYAQTTNVASAKLAMDHISNNFDNPNEVAGGASDLTAAYVKNAQLQGATPDSPQMKEAFASARRDALDAQLNAMAVKDPSRALAILDKNKDIAGVKYDDLANKFRVRAYQQRGQDIGEQAIKKTYQGAAPANFQPVDLTAAGAPYGISGSYLQRVQQIESGSNPNQTSSTGAQGPFQFIPSTAKQYGLKNPFDMQASADAAARLAADNSKALTAQLGRPPTDAELYLAHQQGSDGAAKLLANPNARAGDIVGDKAIRVNGGDPNAPASAFTSMWAAKFAGAPGQANAMRKASAYQDILANPDLDPNVRQHALAYVNQQMTAQQVAEEQTAQAKKAVSDKAMDGYVSRMLTGQNTGNMVNEIANDPNLTPEVKWHLGEAVQKASGNDVQSATQTYGPGFWKAYQQATAPMDDPSRIGDPTTLLRLAGPDVDPEHALTLAGVQKLQTMIRENAKSVDAASVNTTKTGLLNYAKSKLSFEQDTGPVKIRDPEGEAIFNAKFIPKFETAYDNWTKAGKNPYDFLTQENVDKLMTGMRDKSKMETARLNATGEGVDQPIPPTPDGIDEKAWQRVIASPPRGSAGAWPADRWAMAINRLRSDPSPETKAAFDQKFGPSGYTADAVLKRLPPSQNPTPQQDISTEGMPATETGVAEPPTPSLLNRIGGRLSEIRRSNQETLKEMSKPEPITAPGMTSPELKDLVEKNRVTGPAAALGIRG